MCVISALIKFNPLSSNIIITKTYQKAYKNLHCNSEKENRFFFSHLLGLMNLFKF